MDPCTFCIFLKFNFLLPLFKHIILFYIIHLHRLSIVYCKFCCQYTFIWHFAGRSNGGVLCRFGHADRVPSPFFQNVQTKFTGICNIYNIVYIFLLSTVSNPFKPEKLFAEILNDTQKFQFFFFKNIRIIYGGLVFLTCLSRSSIFLNSIRATVSMSDFSHN